MNGGAQTTVDRMASYLSSPQFTEVPDISLSEYWRYFHKEISVVLAQDNMRVSGKSGYYAPAKSKLVTALRGLRSGQLGVADIRNRLLHRFVCALGASEILTSMPITRAFDAIMSAAPLAEISLSPYRIDFRKVAKAPGAFATAADVARDYAAKSGGTAPNVHTYLSYFYYNILNYFGIFTSDFSFLEIGAGNGNLARLLLSRAKKTCYVVDLPRTICGAVGYLSEILPDLKFLLPNEAPHQPHENADLVFLTTAQTDLMSDHAVTLAVNTDSFQEMRREQIAQYFDLINRVVVPRGYFFTNNRVEKIPAADELERETLEQVNRFSEFPWRPGHEVLVYEISRIIRLLGRDAAFMRFERL
ncbi:MAG: putative sugar O-methyltransferase [Alphaproteobacteria bacterium]|nr:putative sugar O-methyltransferase [Alphaproteobacteria bacterium]MDE2495224.1 putative sugar O-methyltransferase [Alphaproteobacteria bacterium]